jgi:trimethylamine--corrinoid protein Co-methyltransferase
MLESGVTFDFGQLVMDNEIARMIKHVVGGIPVSDETLMVDEINAVGAFGDFLSLDSTLRHMRELSQPTLLDRRVRDDWQDRGATDLQERCRGTAVELVESHEAQPLDADIARQIHAIIESADHEKGVA